MQWLSAVKPPVAFSPQQALLQRVTSKQPPPDAELGRKKFVDAWLRSQSAWSTAGSY